MRIDYVVTGQQSTAVEIPGYDIVRELGRGAMATVYLAIRTSLDRPVALKILSPSLTADPSFQERFMKEGRIIARLTHPNIVTVHDIGRHDHALYMDLEYAGGGSLATRPRATISETEAVRITVDIARALSFAHKNNFVHRDIKPANILFREDGTTLLSDFGIAKAMGGDTNLTGVGFTVGTPSYMSPEQASGKPITTQSDIYSLGVTLFEMLTGAKPYVAEDSLALAIKHVNEPIPRLPANLAHYQSVIDSCMAKSPLERYEGGDELIRELQLASVSGDATTVSDGGFGSAIPRSVVGGQGSGDITSDESRPRAMPGETAPLHRGALKRLLVSVVVLGLAGAGGYWYWQRPKPGDVPTFEPQSIDIELVAPENRIRNQANALLQVGRAHRALLDKFPLKDNSTAISEDVAAQIAELIALAHLAGEGNLARTLLDEALGVNPGSAVLQSLRLKLIESGGEINLSSTEQQDVDRLLAEAERHASARRFTLPAGSNALDSYRQVLTIQPYNPLARARLEQLADIFFLQAESAMRQRDFREAGESIEAGLMFYPQHEGLRELSSYFQSSPRP